MSQITAGAGGGYAEGAHSAHAGEFLAPENITPDPARGRPLSLLFFLAGGIGLGAAGMGAFMLWNQHGLKQALAAYHIGVMVCLAMSLGALFWTMIFHLTGSSFAVTSRRQFENVASMIPVCLALLLPTLLIETLMKGVLFTWLNPDVVLGDLIYTKKAVFLSPVFFWIRAIVYAFLWTYLVRRLVGYSTEQDRTGNKWLTNKARFTSSWGMPLFALTLAFAAFDWLMSLDYRFFSTMWGVYYFAGAAFSSIPLVVIILAHFRGRGKLEGLITEEHTHDLGKLMFGFTVFWAYIAFSQYFLIWYANMPEETSWFNARKHEWNPLTVCLCLGHFIIPFLILLWRLPRRNIRVLAIFAVWAIFMEIVDIYWIVRPMVFSHQGVFPDRVQAGRFWLDAAGIIGAMGIYAGFLVRRIYTGPLIPLRDPRLPESLVHKNYV